MSLDFSEIPFFDNHTHTLDASQAVVQPLQLALNFLHGYGDVPPDQVMETDLQREGRGISKELAFHVTHMGVVQTMVCQLAQLYDCEPTLEAVTQERNKRTSKSYPDYIKHLYQDARIVGSMLDSDLPVGHTLIDLFPCPVLRLFRMDPLFFKLLEQVDSFHALRTRFQDTVQQAIRQEGYAGLKCHIGELYTLAARPVDDEEAEKAFSAAKRQDATAMETIYFAIFGATMLQCQELDVPIHIHTGHTGGGADTHINGTNPMLLAQFLSIPKYLNTKIVFLHGAYPHIQTAALTAHTFPHVWVDLSWLLPWASLRADRCFEDVLALAPHSKIMLGSGQHGIPEFAWMASKIAKGALSHVLTRAVRSGLLAERQAVETAELICYQNAQRLYSFPYHHARTDEQNAQAIPTLTKMGGSDDPVQ